MKFVMTENCLAVSATTTKDLARFPLYYIKYSPNKNLKKMFQGKAVELNVVRITC